MTQTAQSVTFRRSDLTEPEVLALLREHLEYAASHSPHESVHALDVSGLRSTGVTFWCMWRGDELVGFGALREIDAHHGEIKSMRTAKGHQRTGLGSAMLAHLLREARERGYRRISLETGGNDAFAPARALYARFGFTPCGPFADYKPDPFSVFMTLEL